MFRLDPRQQSEAQDAFHLDFVVQLGRGQREELAVDRPSGEQVDIQPLQLAGAGAAEGETVGLPVLGDQGMDLVQHARQSLDFVHHHPTSRAPSLDLLPERFGLTAERQESLRPQHVKPQRLRQNLFQPGGFAGSTRAEQEEGMVGQGKSAGKHRQQIDGQSAGGLCKNR